MASNNKLRGDGLMGFESPIGSAHHVPDHDHASDPTHGQKAYYGEEFVPFWAKNNPDGQSVEGAIGLCCGEELIPFLAEDGCYRSVCRRCGQHFTDESQMKDSGSPWIGVDLDGTLACDSGSTGWDKIGKPVEVMAIRVRNWVAQGRTVKIFTARASSPRQVAAIKDWLSDNNLPDLEVTNVKDLRMIELWDDRCVQVRPNSGEPIEKRPAAEQQQPTTTGSSNSSMMSFLSRLRVLLTL